MPDYNDLSFSDGLSLDNLNYSAKLPEDFRKRAEEYAQSAYGAPPPADVMRYPLKAIEKEQDMLLIRIFEHVKGDDIFSLDELIDTDSKTKDFSTVEKFNKDGKLISSQVVLTPGAKITGINRIPTKNERFNAPGQEKKLKKNARYIWLPIPQQVSDSLTVGYAEDTLNPLQAAGLALGSDAIDNPLKAAGRVAEILKNVGNLNVGDDVMSALKTSLAGNAINQLGANVNPTSLITRSSGQILQSNLELLFNNVTLRSFPFTFDFTPRDPDEAKVVMRIIRTIKKATVPKRGNGIFINSPDLFQFQYVAGGERQHPFLNRFKIGVIENVSVDYTASGTYATYDDRTPVHIRMSLAFKEINPIYAEDYTESVAEDGDLNGVGY